MMPSGGRAKHDEKPAAVLGSVVPNLAILFLCISVGTIAFAQVLSSIGYYVGCLVCGYDAQPPVGFVAIGGVSGGAIGSVLGGLAAGSFWRGRRARLVEVVPICLANALALLGTIDVAFDVSPQSLTVRTMIVGAACGLAAGTTLSLLFPREAGPTLSVRLCHVFSLITCTFIGLVIGPILLYRCTSIIPSPGMLASWQVGGAVGGMACYTLLWLCGFQRPATECRKVRDTELSKPGT